MRLKKEIRRQAFGLRRIHASGCIAKLQPCRGRPTASIAHRQPHRARGQHVEQHRHFRAKAEVLRALTDVKLQCRLAFAGLVAVNQNDGVLRLQAAEARQHRRFAKHLHRQESPLGALDVFVVLQLRLRLSSQDSQRRAGIHRACLRTPHPHRPRHGGVVEHFYKERRKAALPQFRLRRPTLHLDTQFGIYRNRCQHMRIEHFLNHHCVAFFDGHLKLLCLRLAQWHPEKFQRLDHPRCICPQWLAFDFGNWQLGTSQLRKKQQSDQWSSKRHYAAIFTQAHPESTSTELPRSDFIFFPCQAEVDFVPFPRSL